MCATYQLYSDEEENVKIQSIISEVEKKYGEETALKICSGDFFPKSMVPVETQEDGIVLMRWGFPMFQSKQVVFNAREVTLAEKPMFRKSLISKRCLLPASKFYEWDSGKKKLAIRPEDSGIFYIAGLYNEFTLLSGEKQTCVVMITTAPNSQMLPIHNRMPAILADNSIFDWMNAGEGLVPYAGDLWISPVTPVTQ